MDPRFPRQGPIDDHLVCGGSLIQSRRKCSHSFYKLLKSNQHMLSAFYGEKIFLHNKIQGGVLLASWHLGDALDALDSKN